MRKSVKIVAVVIFAVVAVGCHSVRPGGQQNGTASAADEDKIHWGKKVGEFQVGIAAVTNRATRQGDLRVRGFLKNVGDKPVEVDTYCIGRLCLNVYRTRDAAEGDHILTRLPPMPPKPGTEGQYVRKLAAGEMLDFVNDLDFFSPELKPGRYWVEFLLDDGARSPRVDVEVLPAASASPENVKSGEKAGR